jgi:hypothetical protein
MLEEYIPPAVVCNGCIEVLNDGSSNKGDAI